MSHPPAPPRVVLLMGVSGSGKSTMGGVLAGRLGWQLGEGDDMHPAENVAKMAAGHPLTDDDRPPWLRRIAKWIDERLAAGESAIVTSSALKRAYRDVLRRDGVTFVYLAGSREQIARRLTARHGHFMPATLLDSQFETLQPPTPDEHVLTVDTSGSPQQEADFIISELHLQSTTGHPGAASSGEEPQ